MEDTISNQKSRFFFSVGLSLILFLILGVIFPTPFLFLTILYLAFLAFSYLFGIFSSPFPPFYGINFKTEMVFILTFAFSFLLQKVFPPVSPPALFWFALLLYLNFFEPIFSLILAPKRKVPILFVAKDKASPFPKSGLCGQLEPLKIISKGEIKDFLTASADRLGRIHGFRAIVLEKNDPEIKRLTQNYLTDFFLLKSSCPFSYFTGCPIERIEDLPFFSFTLRLKRIIDFTLSLLILLFTLPFFLFIALCVKLDSSGPVFYRHKRIGRNGKSFYLLKFRTMIADADKKLATILAKNPSLADEFNKKYKLKNDPRITPFGKLLRSFSIDELPQFINVLKGDMSLVGPRPIVEGEISYYQNASRLPFKFFPGVTGLWQTSGRTETSYETRVALDEAYCHNWNLLTDLKLILKTIPAVLSQRGAY